ncbi:MAG: iron-containing alcohol dehydrogenase [Deltaproteobacteria bacterium]|nr:iron-containing alcohol dehydrogenase [Deltaproteobacteria bacterium]
MTTADIDALRANWNYPTAIRFGVGRIKELPDACRELGIQRPLLITDPVLARLPMTKEVVRICDRSGLATSVFCDIKPNPVGKNVEDGVRAFRRGNRDGVIAFGGGSALDAAKAVALMIGQTRPLWDFEDVGDNWTRVDLAGMRPCVAVPTTAGTGSEVGRVSVIVDERLHQKKLIFHPKLQPARVICDPALTVGMPPRLTGETGMDALSHSLEAYCSPFFHPQAAGIALEGMRLVHRSLLNACAEPADLLARAEMLAASLLGAAAFQRGLGAMHAVAHACGGLLDTPHGRTIAVMMPYVLALNRPVIDERLARLAAYLGFRRPSFESVLDWVLGLRRQLGIPHALAELGARRDHLAPLTELAVADPSGGTNPVALTKVNLRQLIARALDGALPIARAAKVASRSRARAKSGAKAKAKPRRRAPARRRS